MPLPQHNDLSDEALIAAFRRSQDNKWLGMLLERYTLLLLGVAMKYLKDQVAAQDAVQQVFLKALTHFPEGAIQNFKGWLYILMRNFCFQQLRDRAYAAPEEMLQNVVAEDITREAHDAHEYTLAQMQDALQQLSHEQQLCVRLFYLNKKSYQDIMAQTGFSFAQVKSYIQNGKRNLKILLTARLGKDFTP